MSDFDYHWLLSARLLRQKTQKEVSEAIGLSQGKLSKAESGVQSLPESILQELANYYDVPVSFFRQEWDSTPVSHLLFRRRVTIPSKVIDSITEEVRRRKCSIDNLMRAVDMPEYDLGSFFLDSSTTAELVATQIRYKLKCINGPLLDLAKRLENHGVIIQFFDFGTDLMDGMTTITSHGHKVIFLNSRMPNDRVRFSLAHELGHLVMHLDDYLEADRDVEDEANRFASQLLMPENEIKYQLFNLTFKRLEELKQRWRVSMRALVKRAYDLDILDQIAYRNYQISFSKKGYNKKEPIQIPLEEITVLETVKQLYESELGYSDKEMMDLMLLNERDYHSWFDSSKRPFFITINKLSH